MMMAKAVLLRGGLRVSERRGLAGPDVFVARRADHAHIAVLLPTMRRPESVGLFAHFCSLDRTARRAQKSSSDQILTKYTIHVGLLFTVLKTHTENASPAFYISVYFHRVMFIGDVGKITLALLVVCSSGAALPTQAEQGQPTLWSHNGSVFYLVKNGKGREFHYEKPRAEMVQAGAYRGALLFAGQSNNHQYSGTAFLFSSRCGQLAYQVSGPILDNHERVHLKGRAPRVGPDCTVTGYVDDTLDFQLIKAPPEAAIPIPQTSPPASTSTPSLSAPLKREGDTFLVPVLINKAIVLDFVVDSGAGDVTIPQDVFTTLIRTGTIQESDLTGTRTYRLANGPTEALPTFKIRSLTLAGTVIEDVSGSVTAVEGSLLLGQSFLTRFKSWSIDNAKEALLLEPYGGRSPPVFDARRESPAPAPDTQEAYSVVKNLNMREFPDPKSANVLSRWAPEDFVPQGTTFTGERFCQNGPTGYIWCHVTYHHHGTQTGGWVAGYYLWSAKEKQRVACLYASPDPDCSR
jgi:predicted aspartyl protease